MSLRSSGNICAVRGCTYNTTKLNLWLQQECFEHAPLTKRECSCVQRYRFHRLPKNEESRTIWLKNLNLEKPVKTIFVCSFHFVDKKPTQEHPYPTLWLGDQRPAEKREKTSLKSISNSATTADESSDERDEMNEEQCSTSEPTRDAQTQWSDPGMEDHTYSKVPPIMSAPSSELSHPVADSVLESVADSLLYTGIQLIEFHILVSCLQPFAPASSSMPVVDQILMTLMKLRQNFDMADLARRFKTSQRQVKQTVGMWIDIMSEHIKDLIPWLPRETIKATLPQAFKEHFPNTTCVIGRTETVSQKVTKGDTVGELQSHSYGNNTVKYLVAISPSGIIMFISDAYDDKCSDRYIMQTSGILKHLRPGDEVIMGDCGFLVGDLLEERRVNLIMPLSPNKRKQLTNEEVTRSQRIAHAYRHVERAIRRLKVYKILSQTVPIKLVPKISKMLTVCAGLVNLRGEFK